MGTLTWRTRRSKKDTTAPTMLVLSCIGQQVMRPLLLASFQHQTGKSVSGRRGEGNGLFRRNRSTLVREAESHRSHLLTRKMHLHLETGQCGQGRGFPSLLGIEVWLVVVPDLDVETITVVFTQN